MRRIGEPRSHHADIGLFRLADLHHRPQIALEIAAGNAEAGAEIGARADAPVELQRRRDVRPVGADPLADFGQGVGDRDRCHQAEIDADLGKLGALVGHRQDRAGERFEERPQRRRQRAARVGAADDEALGLGRALDRAPEDEGLDLVVELRRRHRQRAGVSRRHLREDHEHAVGGKLAAHALDHRLDRRQIALTPIVGRHVDRDVHHVASAERAVVGAEHKVVSGTARSAPADRARSPADRHRQAANQGRDRDRRRPCGSLVPLLRSPKRGRDGSSRHNR